MNRFIAFTLAVLVLLQPFNRLWIYVSFKINQDVIAKTLCVKKEVVNNTCKGKCQLKKQLAKADNQENNQLPSTLKHQTEIPYCKVSKFSGVKFPSTLVNQVKINSYMVDSYYYSFTQTIFHPPQFLLG